MFLSATDMEKKVNHEEKSEAEKILRKYPHCKDGKPGVMLDFDLSGQSREAGGMAQSQTKEHDKGDQGKRW